MNVQRTEHQISAYKDLVIVIPSKS